MIIDWGINPVAFDAMGLEIRWYGIFFTAALYAVYFSLLHSLCHKGFSKEQSEGFFFGAVIAIIIGAKVFHFLVYEPSVLFSDPLRIFNLRAGGLASHGGIIALAAWLIFYCKRHYLSMRHLLDSLVFPVLAFAVIVRVGNFFNSEVYGIPTNENWGVVFKNIDDLPRYPSQLIEAGMYLLLTVSLWTSNYKALKKGVMFSCLMVSMSVIRFAVELTKENQAEYTLSGLNTGAILSIITFAIGVFLSSTFNRSKDSQ